MENDYKGNVDKSVTELLKEFIDTKLPNRRLTMFTGRVEDNVDPDKLGRCKIRVFGVFDDGKILTQDLPWATPEQTFIGSTVGNFIVPPIDTLVRVYFDGDDIYSPVYTSKAVNSNQLPSSIAEDYPSTMVFFETDNGDYVTINRKTMELDFHHSSGMTFKIDADGNVVFDTTATEEGKLSLTIKGDVSINSDGDVTIEATKGNVKLGSNANVSVPNVQNDIMTGAPLAIGRNFNGTPGSVQIPL
jgi:hypothetical protein